jgi:predicted AlkP superfamily phosphohydrolase/phosphomutase
MLSFELQRNRNAMVGVPDTMSLVKRPSEKSEGGERLLIIGWDGADWEVLDDLIRRGHLPNVGDMRRHGAFGGLRSTMPSHSWAAWSTFLTGVNCGRHGVYDFAERRPGELRSEIPVSSDSIRATTFLERLSEAGHDVRAANIPVTFPPIPVKGRMISGVAIPAGAQFVHPPEWADELERRGPFPLNGMEWSRFENDPEALVDEAKRFVDLRTRSFEVLLEGNWSVAVCVYVAPDRLQHPFGAHLLPSHPRHADVSETPLAASIRELYGLLDSHIGRLRAAAGPSATTVLMSDHGFRPIDRVANLTEVLCALGFAALAPGSGRRARVSRAASRARVVARKLAVFERLLEGDIGNAVRRRVRPHQELDWSKTVAYQSVRGGGVSINLEGREPNGIVPPHGFKRVRDKVRDALLAYEDPSTGLRPVEAVLPGEELYTGPYAELGPDLLVQPKRLWAFTYTETPSGTSRWPTGAHRQLGILLSAGGRTVPGDLGERDIADIAATALAFCGVASSAIDGRPIAEIAGGTGHSTHATGVGVPTSRTPANLSEEDQRQIAEHLRKLGYIE